MTSRLPTSTILCLWDLFHSSETDQVSSSCSIPFGHSPAPSFPSCHCEPAFWGKQRKTHSAGRREQRRILKKAPVCPTKVGLTCSAKVEPLSVVTLLPICCCSFYLVDKRQLLFHGAADSWADRSVPCKGIQHVNQQLLV